MTKPKTQTVFVVQSKTTGEWWTVADSQAVAEAYILTRGLSDTHNVSSVELMTRRDIDPTALANTTSERRAEHRARTTRVGRCPDCGQQGERAGHMGCMFPENH